jgi:hypothetical protein
MTDTILCSSCGICHPPKDLTLNFPDMGIYVAIDDDKQWCWTTKIEYAAGITGTGVALCKECYDYGEKWARTIAQVYFSTTTISIKSWLTARPPYSFKPRVGVPVSAAAGKTNNSTEKVPTF